MKKQKWRFCIIGSLAVYRWGEMRTTLDVDLTLFTGFGEEEKFADALITKFPVRKPDAREIALRQRVTSSFEPPTGRKWISPSPGFPSSRR